MTITPNNSATAIYDNIVNQIDLLKCPQLAQQMAAAGQGYTAQKLNNLISKVNDAQKNFIEGSVKSGFDSAGAMQWGGLAQLAMAGGNVGVAVPQVTQAGANTAAMKEIEDASSADLQALDSQNRAREASLEVENIDDALPGGQIQADAVGAHQNTPEPPKSPSRKQLLSDREIRLEQAKSENNQASARLEGWRQAVQGVQWLYTSQQANSDLSRTVKDVQNNNQSAGEATKQSAMQTGQSIFQFNPYAQNIRA